MTPKRNITKPVHVNHAIKPGTVKPRLAGLRLAVPSRPAPPSTGPTGTRRKTRKPSEKQRFIWAVGQQESGHNYGAINGSSGALGAYQVMPANLPGWLGQAGLPQMTPNEYLHNRSAQDHLAWIILGGDYNRYGPRGAAAVWYSGQSNWHATYGNPPVYQYVDDVMALMGASGAGTNPVPESGGSVSLGVAPRPGKDDWSPHIKAHAASLKATAHDANRHANYIKALF